MKTSNCLFIVATVSVVKAGLVFGWHGVLMASPEAVFMAWLGAWYKWGRR